MNDAGYDPADGVGIIKDLDCVIGLEDCHDPEDSENTDTQ